MTSKSKNSLLDITRKSLNNEQINSCFDQFKEATKAFIVLPQVELVDQFDEKKRVELKFTDLSDSGTVNCPRVVLEVTESCQNMETVKVVHAQAIDCGMCRGGSNVTFNNKNVNKFDIVLANIQELFQKNYEMAMKEDKIQLDFNKVIEEAKDVLSHHLGDNDDRYSDEYFGNVKGDFRENRDDKTFNIDFDGLNIEQIRKLGTVIPNL